MLSDDSSSCERAEALRDYAFEELPASERQAMEQHIAVCGRCSLELDQLRLTTTALRTLPDREIPQRIAFVSDRIFKPTIFAWLWNPGFASACVLAAALVVSAWHVAAAYRPAAVASRINPPAAIQAASSASSASPEQINAAVADAVAKARSEDAQMIQAAVQSAENKRDAEYRAQIVALEENFDVLRKTMNLSYARLERTDGAAQ